MPRAAVVVNLVNVNAGDLRAAVAAAAERAGWSRSVRFETTREDPRQGVSAQALAHAPDVVLVVGGDGTVRAAAAGLHASSTPMAIVPIGTGNLLARNLRLPLSDLHGGVAAGFIGTDRRIDLVEVTLRQESGAISREIFLAMAGIGLDAAMAQNSKVLLKKWLGWVAYVTPIAQSILSNRSFELDTRVGRRTRAPRQVHTMIVGNCGVLTGDVVSMPAAVVDDGLLDIVILRPGRLIGWIPIALRLIANGIVYRRSSRPRGLPSSRTAYHQQAASLEATFSEPQLIQVDGDIFGDVTSAQFRILPAALNIRTPEASPSRRPDLRTPPWVASSPDEDPLPTRFMCRRGGGMGTVDVHGCVREGRGTGRSVGSFAAVGRTRGGRRPGSRCRARVRGRRRGSR